MSGEGEAALTQLWSAFRRRLPWFASVAVVLFAAAAVAALVWPPQYKSTGIILIEQQELPADLVRSLVSSYATQRIQVISQRVMTTQNLTRIIDRYDLYTDLRRREPGEQVIARMRRDTSLQMISADVIDPREGRAIKATIAFSITYANRSPELAARVANELVSLYLQQNIEVRERSSRDAEDFLASEGARLSGDIDALQSRYGAFKRLHASELPELTQLNLQGLSRLDDDIRETDSQIELLAQQVPYVEAQLAQTSRDSAGDKLGILKENYARAAGVYSPDHPDVVRLRREIAGLQAGGTDAAGESIDRHHQLEEAQTQLTAARQKYSAEHPDVQRLQRLVASLQDAAGDEPAASASMAGDAAGGSTTGTTAAFAGSSNPLYFQLSTQRQSLLTQVKVLKDKRAALQAKRDSAEQLLTRAPLIEREYTNLVRDLDSAQGQYREVHQKQMEAQISGNLESERKGERFTLIEPPLAAQEPTSPNRVLIILFGLIVALAAGVGTVIVLEALDGSIRGAQDLQRLLSVPPLAIIPNMLASADHRLRSQRWRRALYATAGGALVAVAMIHVFYRPLDVLWQVALRHIGLQS